MERLASGAGNLNEAQRQLDTFISREKGLKERVIDQGGGVEINLRERAGWTKQPLSAQQFPPQPFVKHRAAIFADYFQVTSMFLNKNPFESQVRFARC